MQLLVENSIGIRIQNKEDKILKELDKFHDVENLDYIHKNFECDIIPGN
eukprot:UN19417